MSPGFPQEPFVEASQQQPSVEQDYPQAWRRRRARRLIALRLLIIAAVLAIAGAIGSMRGAAWAPIPIGLVFPVLVMANLIWIWSLFLRCPRCGSQFGMQSRPGRSASRNPFAKSCMSCGLPLRMPR